MQFLFSVSPDVPKHVFVIQWHKNSATILLFVSLPLHNCFLLILCLPHSWNETNPDPNPQTLLLSILNYHGNRCILPWIPVVLHLTWPFSRKLCVTSRHTHIWCCFMCHNSLFSHQEGHKKITFNYINQTRVTVACLEPSAMKCKRGYNCLFAKKNATISATTNVLIYFFLITFIRGCFLSTHFIFLF